MGDGKNCAVMKLLPDFLLRTRISFKTFLPGSVHPSLGQHWQWPRRARGSGSCWGLLWPDTQAASHPQTGSTLRWRKSWNWVGPSYWLLSFHIIQKPKDLSNCKSQVKPQLWPRSLKFESSSTSFPHLSQESLSQATHCICQVHLTGGIQVLANLIFSIVEDKKRTNSPGEGHSTRWRRHAPGKGPGCFEGSQWTSQAPDWGRWH